MWRAAAAMIAALVVFCAGAPALAQTSRQGATAPAANAPLTDVEMRALVARVVANQHRNDDALNLYERREHRIVWESAEQKKIADDKLYRVVPTGTGTIKMVLADGGKPTPAPEYRKQLQYVEQALVWALNPAEPKQKARVDKFEKKARERSETVDAVLDAYTFTFLGRETRNGRTLVKLRFDPNPAYNPPSRSTDMLSHATAVVWIEPAAAQLVRIEAELARDFSIGGGFLGKVYKGGRFVMEQAPVGDGVWLPIELRYGFRGRKFVFGFDLFEETRASDYRRIGPPAQALAAVRAELNGARASGSP